MFVTISRWFSVRKPKITGVPVRSSGRKLGCETLEPRSLMAADVFVDIHSLPDDYVDQGQRSVIAAELDLSKARNGVAVPQSLFFPVQSGSRAVTRPRLTGNFFGNDNVFETTISVGQIDARGNVSFNIRGWGTVATMRGTDLRFEFDVAANATDGTRVQFGVPTVGFPNLRFFQSSVYYVGAEGNPTYIVGEEEIIPLTVTNRNPDANNTSVPTGHYSFARFGFSAGSRDVDIGILTFLVGTANIKTNVDDLRVYNMNDSTTYVTPIAYDLFGNVLRGSVMGSYIVVANLRGTGVDNHVDAGTGETFALSTNVLNAQVLSSVTSTLQGSLLLDGRITSSTLYVT